MRERILSATARAFARFGLNGASMADIIAESGLSAGAIYGYFKSKDELIAAFAEDVLTGRVSDVQSIARRDPVPEPADAVRMFVALLPQQLIDDGLVVELWAAAARNPHVATYAKQSFHTLRQAFEHYLTRYAEKQGLDQESARRWADRAVPVFMSHCQGYLLTVSVLGRGPADEVLQGLDTVRFVPTA